MMTEHFNPFQVQQMGLGLVRMVEAMMLGRDSTDHCEVHYQDLEALRNQLSLFLLCFGKAAMQYVKDHPAAERPA